MATPTNRRRSETPPATHRHTKARQAALYLRVSSDDQVKGYSLTDQEAMLRQWCRSRGVDVAATFRDEGVSAKSRATVGESFSTRPGWQRMMEWLRGDGQACGLVLFKDYSRFSRDATDALVTIRQLDALGVEVQAAEQPIDWSVPEQVPLVMLYIGMPEAENRRRALNIRRGVQRAHLEGRWIQTAPTGYVKRYDDRGKPYIVPDPDTAHLVRDAFDLAAAGDLSIDAIRKTLRKQDGKMLMGSPFRFAQMLQNRAYLGEVHVKPDAAQGIREHWVDGMHDALVSQVTFDRAQLRFQSDARRTKTTLVEELPLRRHLLDPSTGTRLGGSGSKSRHGYRVWYYHGRGKGAFRIKADDAHEQFSGYLKSISLSGPVMRLFRAILTEVVEERSEGASVRLSVLTRKRGEVQEQLDAADDLFISGKLGPEAHARATDRYHAELQRVADGVREIEALRGANVEAVGWGVGLLGSLDEAWKRAPIEGKSALVGSIWPDGLVVETSGCRTPEPSSILTLLSAPTLSVSGINKVSPTSEEAGLTGRWRCRESNPGPSERTNQAST